MFFFLKNAITYSIVAYCKYRLVTLFTFFKGKEYLLFLYTLNLNCIIQILHAFAETDVAEHKTKLPIAAAKLEQAQMVE